MKFVITASMSYFNFSTLFLKPLQAYLGETYYGKYLDGTDLYAEQFSVYPPVSYFFIKGSENKYTYYGYYQSEAKAGLNTMNIYNCGKKFIKF